MSDTPVAVAMAAYNAERYLGEALESVLAQHRGVAEVVVCDDASTDGTRSVVRAFGARDPRVRLLESDERLGGYGAMNAAVRATSSPFVAVYHADDVYGPEIIQREADFLDAHPDASAAFCLDRFIDADGRTYRHLTLPPELAGGGLLDRARLTEAMLRHKNRFLRTPSVMFRRSAFDAVDGFDQDRWGIQADVDMWLRIASEGPIGLIPEHLYGYRHYPSQWSGEYERLRTSRELFFDIMDRHLSEPGVRDGVSDEALQWYQIWRVQDEAECAANRFVLGDAPGARALLGQSWVRPLLRSKRWWQVVRVLGLRTVVRAAISLGSGPLARRLVYWARFRKWPDRLTAGTPGADHALGGSVPRAGAAASARPVVAEVFLDPFTSHFEGDALFDPRSKLNRDDCLRPWRILRRELGELGIRIRTADYLDTRDRTLPTFYVSFGVRERWRKLARRPDVMLNAFYLFEVVVVDPEMYRAIPDLCDAFRRVYTWSDGESLAPYAGGVMPVHNFRIPAPREAVVEPLWSRTDRNGVVMISSNRTAALPEGELYTSRLQTLKAFVSRGMDFDLWGMLWDRGLGQREGEFGDAVQTAYRGPTADKYDTLSRYRVAICYENMSLRGWITEKLFDCLVAGTVPVYHGAPEITDVVPASCFIDRRDFADDQELARFIQGLTRQDLDAYRQAGRTFLESPAFRPFSAQGFVDRMKRDLEDQLRERGEAVPWA